MTQEIVTGHMAHVLASQLTAQGYRVDFPPGRDPAAFMALSRCSTGTSPAMT